MLMHPIHVGLSRYYSARVLRANKGRTACIGLRLLLIGAMGAAALLPALVPWQFCALQAGLALVQAAVRHASSPIAPWRRVYRSLCMCMWICVC